MSGPSNLLAMVDREVLLRGSLESALPMMWPVIETSQYKSNWHIGLISELLTAVLNDELHDVIINIPPGCMKSALCSVMFPAWAWFRQPTLRFACASFDQQLVLRDARRHADIISDPRFVAAVGDRVRLPRSYADSLIKNLQGGWRYSTSIPGGKITGWHADIHVYDDPHKPADIGFKPSRDKVLKWVGETAATRFQQIARRKRILIMQRLHEEDMAGYLEANSEGSWHVCRLPMEYEKSYSYPKDPRTEEGELLWPELKPKEAVEKLKKDLRAQGTASQLQQRPSPEAGDIFKREWMQFYRKAALPKRFDQIIQSWDCAFLDEETSDWVVGQVWGSCGPDLYLLEQYRGHWDAPATAGKVLEVTVKWPKARRKLVEKKANGAAVIQMLKKRVSGLLPIEPDGGKVSRANAASSCFESKNVFLPHPDEAPWVDGLIHELLMFPNGKNDDQVDATSQAINYLDKRRLKMKEFRESIETGRFKLFDPMYTWRMR